MRLIKDALRDTGFSVCLVQCDPLFRRPRPLTCSVARRWPALLLVLAEGAARILISNIFEDLGFSFHSHRAVAKAVGTAERRPARWHDGIARAYVQA